MTTHLATPKSGRCHRPTATCTSIAILCAVASFVGIGGGCDHEHEHAANAHTHADGTTHTHAHSHGPADHSHGEAGVSTHDHEHEHTGGDHNAAATRDHSDEIAYRDVPPAPVFSDHQQQHPSSDPSAACTCTVNMYHGGWCKRCNVGHVAGQRIDSTRLFETLDPHGHDIDLPYMQATICPEGVSNDAWCDAGGMGFVQKKAYFTRLTFGLAKGKPLVVDRLACPMCRSHGVGTPGWCDTCGRGIIGTVAFADRAMFDRTAAEFDALLAAIARVDECETCAMMMVVHRTCPYCRISYENTSLPASADVQAP